MNVNAGSPNVVPEAVARTEVIVDTMRGKFLDWLRTTEGTLKGYLSTLETGRIQMCSEVQAGAADAVVAGSRMKKNGLGGTLEVYLYQGTPADGRVIR